MTPRDFISKALADATDIFGFFDALVAKMDADAARIAELEAKLAEANSGLYLAGIRIGGFLQREDDMRHE